MNGHETTPATSKASPIEEAYRRVAQLHYALSTADAVDEGLHQRAIDELMDILEVLEPAMPSRPSGRATIKPTR